MKTPADSFDFETQVLQWLDGESTAQEKDFLVQHLKDHPHLEHEFLEISRVHSQLNTHFQADQKQSDLKARLLNTLQEEAQHKTLKRSIFKEIEVTEKHQKKTSIYKTLSLAALAFICFSLVFIILQSNQDNKPKAIAKVLNFKGDVLIIRNNKTFRLSNEFPLEKGDQIKTSDEQNCSIIYPDLTKLDIFENTLLALQQENGAKIHLLEQGRIKADVSPQPTNQPLQVKTKNTLSTVLGTIFEIKTHYQNTQLTVMKGKVGIQRLSDQASIIVSRKKYVDIFKDNPLQLQPYRSFSPTLHKDPIRLIKIDFGTEDHQTQRWNNVFKDLHKKESSLDKLIDTNTFISNLTDSKLRATGIRLNMSETVMWKNNTGYENDSEQGYPRKATRDSIWGSEKNDHGMINPNIQLSFSGLNPHTPYSFTFYGSVMSDKYNLETEYQVLGQQNETVYLNVALNKNQTQSTSPLYATEQGIIEVIVKKGPNNNHPKGHYFLGAMVISIFDKDI